MANRARTEVRTLREEHNEDTTVSKPARRIHKEPSSFGAVMEPRSHRVRQSPDHRYGSLNNKAT